MYNVGGYGNYNVSKNYNYVKNNAKKTEEKENPDFLENLQNNKKPEKTYDGFKVESAKEKTGELSKTAEDYLKKLKKKFPGMDFIIADFSTDEEADALLAKGKGEYNALITPDLLEKMAADEAVAAEYEGIIETSVADMKSAKEQLGDDGDMLEKMGVSVDSEGNVTYHATLIEGLMGDNDTNTVTGSTIEELLKRLNEVKESQAEKLAEIRAKKAEEAKEAEEAKKAEEAKEKKQDMTLSDVEKIAAGVVDWAEELNEVTKFADFNADA
ncbi:MAG: hypothetical protein IJX15_02100 [Ruminiclostridium sp.]|nr:hypothetical protein [Ruminiclostridium sp.]MBQ8410508.1 hypothetical protein [Ruminiclostridium sp.]MBQ8842083.1 hypothetical protein [Ruminiclostridium sp.]